MDSPNSQTVWMALIAGVVQIVLALIARADRNTKHIDTSAKIDTLEKTVDGKLTAYIKVSGDARAAEGNLAGHREEKESPT